MKLYHVSQSENDEYDTYSDFVVCAESEEEARNTHPDQWKDNAWSTSDVWCKSPDQVEVVYIGEAATGIDKGIICASFHAG
jgi:hypothetical protein